MIIYLQSFSSRFLGTESRLIQDVYIMSRKNKYCRHDQVTMEITVVNHILECYNKSMVNFIVSTNLFWTRFYFLAISDEIEHTAVWNKLRWKVWKTLHTYIAHTYGSVHNRNAIYLNLLFGIILSFAICNGSIIGFPEQIPRRNKIIHMFFTQYCCCFWNVVGLKVIYKYFLLRY